MKRIVTALAVVLALGAFSPSIRTTAQARQAAPSAARASQTALDRYVAAPDDAFAWKVANTVNAAGMTATLIELTSQRWLTEAEVEQPLWRHWLWVIAPEKVTSDIAFMAISGGRNDRNPPNGPAPWLPELAGRTGTVAS